MAQCGEYGSLGFISAGACCVAMAAEKLRDLSQPIDVALLDATVAAFYGTGSKEEVRDCSSFLAPVPVWFSRKCGKIGAKLKL